MKIDNQDIIRTARQLRDEQNEQLHVRSWSRKHHFRVPTWLVAVPAAAIVGFVTGLFTQVNFQKDTPLTALVDTVYVSVPVPQVSEESPSHTVPEVSDVAPRRSGSVSTKRHRKQQAVGNSVADDNIRYDLLVTFAPF